MRVFSWLKRFVVIGCLSASTAFAVPPPLIPTLRAELAALKDTPPQNVPWGALESVGYQLDVAERLQRRSKAQADAWSKRAATFLKRIQEGQDPFTEQRGKITTRGYWSKTSIVRQGYSVYLPPNYDASKAYPLMLVLHGGSSNGNLFLGVVLGNNMNWLTYDKHLWDEFTPRWTPDWIVVAPDGFGQVMWRWMGEQDVLDVLEDVQKHYHVDANRVVLCGLSNGGVGAYSIGMRHAHRFSAVLALAGAPSWLMYTGGRPSDAEKRVMQAWSGMDLSKNAFNTDLRAYHGHTDPGPMKPRFVTEFEAHLKRAEIPHRMTWYNTGHDILYLVHKHGKIFDSLTSIQRRTQPSEVHLVTADYRARRQHWLEVTRIENYPTLARLVGKVSKARLEIQTFAAQAFSIYLQETPLKDGDPFEVHINGSSVYKGTQKSTLKRLDFVQNQNTWRLGAPAQGKQDTQDKTLVKRPGLSGPLTDAYFDAMIHVYGTQNPAHTEALKRAAEKGAQGWPLWLWNFKQKVVADTAVTPEMMQANHVVVYGTPKANAILERLQHHLPIRVEHNTLRFGAQVLRGKDVGTRFIYPNPEAPQRYVVVQAGLSTEAVNAGHRLPDFLPDYVVYDATSTRSRPRLIAGSPPLQAGFFDDAWRLPQPNSFQNAALPLSASTESEDTSAIARQIAQRVPTFFPFRKKVPKGTWIESAQALWSIRDAAQCLDALKKKSIPAEPLAAFVTPVPTPVRILGPVHGVEFRSLHKDRDVIMACEMAQRLPTLVEVAKRYDITSIGVLSSYRDKPYPSFHTFGLALDITDFQTPRGVLSVLDDFLTTPNFETCKAPLPKPWKAAVLQSLACDLARTQVFSSVLTPNYNEGHRNHIHLDIRPEDPHIFIR